MYFTIVGAGAIGGTVGAYLARAGHEILFVDQDVSHVEAIATQGLTIEGRETFTVRAPAVTPAALTDRSRGTLRVSCCCA
jgi:2-dehydropantoate 2-reductase